MKLITWALNFDDSEIALTVQILPMEHAAGQGGFFKRCAFELAKKACESSHKNEGVFFVLCSENVNSVNCKYNRNRQLF